MIKDELIVKMYYFLQEHITSKYSRRNRKNRNL